MFESGFEYPKNYLRMYKEISGKKVETDQERLELMQYFTVMTNSTIRRQQRQMKSNV